MKVLQKNDRLAVEKIDDSIILHDNELQTKSILDDVSAFIWKALDKTQDMNKIAEMVSNIYDVDIHTASKDVISTIEKFKKLSLISDGTLLLNENVIAFYDNGRSISYFPSKRVIIESDNLTCEAIKNNNLHEISEEDLAILKRAEIINSDLTPDDHKKFIADYPTRIILLPTTDCNLKCKYCYASAGIAKKKYMSWESAKAAIDYTFNNFLTKYKTSNGRKAYSLGFMGGGEPTLNFDVITKSTQYVRELGKKENVETVIDLTTNAVLDNEKLQWICENVDFIRISFDGPRDIQNLQRPSDSVDSYEAVCKSINTFDKFRKNYLIRCTVTSDIVRRMPEILEFYLNNFQLEKKSIIFNPVYVCGSCTNNNIQSIEEKVFAEKFIECQKMVENIDVDIVSSYDRVRTAVIPKLPYCGFKKGNCFFTPDGYLSTCSEVDSIEDIRAPFFFFGKYEEDTKELMIAEDKLKQLYKVGSTKTTCTSCNISSFCPGMCLVRGLNLELAADLQTSVDDILSPLSEEVIEAIDDKAGHNKQSEIQCRLSRDISKKEIIYAADYQEEMENKGTFKTIILFNSDKKKGIKKVVQLSI